MKKVQYIYTLTRTTNVVGCMRSSSSNSLAIVITPVPGSIEKS